jgi:23S rRNA pseudouridine2605 synthase
VTEMRLQRALARAGVASRRAAEQLIEDGKVRVDGRVATLGMKVDPDRQKITVGGKTVKAKERRWLAFHKPLGVVTTASDEEGRRTVLDYIPDNAGLTYVGRLDVMTTGLLLLTTDGEAVHAFPGGIRPWSTDSLRPKWRRRCASVWCSTAGPSSPTKSGCAPATRAGASST